MQNQHAMQQLDKIIDKARVHLYKPIQIAEILYRARVHGDIDLANLETYRNISKKWRDLICLRFLGRTSSSSARYQDDVFNNNAIPPRVLLELAKINTEKAGYVEAYIYSRFRKRFEQMSSGLDYCITHNRKNFQLMEFLSVFWNEAGLRRSIDKIYEIVVFSLFSALIQALDITVAVSLNTKKLHLLDEFEDFTKRVMKLSVDNPNFMTKARFHRVGITNAADRGLDMWANFGLAIQIKHLSLSEEIADSIVSNVSADRIVIVCKDTEEKIIISLLNQIGWKAKIQSIITEKDLNSWYEKALRGKYAENIAPQLLTLLQDEIKVEFPVTEKKDFEQFYSERGYTKLL